MGTLYPRKGWPEQAQLAMQRTVWVTQEGLARDDFVSAGESLCIVCNGVTLVEPIGNTAARLTLRPVVFAAAARRRRALAV